MGHRALLGWVARDGKIILLEKAVRTIPYGFMSVVFPIYLSQLGFNSLLVGLILTLTTVTSAFYTFIASLVADRIGRRKTLVFFALTDSIAGSLLFLVASPWGPVAAGVVGNISVGAGEVGPYLSLEQAILPKMMASSRRTVGFSVYNLIGYGASASGALIAGLPQFNGTGLVVFRPLFLTYLLSGLLGVLLYYHVLLLLPIPSAVELSRSDSGWDTDCDCRFLSSSCQNCGTVWSHQHDGLHSRAFECNPGADPFCPLSLPGRAATSWSAIDVAARRRSTSVFRRERCSRIRSYFSIRDNQLFT